MVSKEEKPVVIIEILEKLEKLPTNEPNCNRVCVCHVPHSLSFVKPEAYIPQFVGLGPYHHWRSELIMTTELKLGVVRRVLKLKPKPNTDMFDQNIVSDIQPLYHADVHLKSDYPTDLSSVFTVDGLFLLALLDSDVGAIILQVERTNTFFLTGKPGMPLVNIHGVELSVGSIFREVFMIENQIPTRVLKLVNKALIDRNEFPDKDLDSAMRTFCGALSPFVVSDINLFKFAEDHDHLLDLLYKLITYLPESEADPESQTNPGLNETLMTMFYMVTLISSTGFILLFFLQLIFRLIKWVIHYLVHRSFPSIVAAPQSIKLLGILDAPIYSTDLLTYINGGLEAHSQCTRILAQLIERTDRWFQGWDSTSSSNKAAIPSATELCKNRIQFESAEGSISSGKVCYIFKFFFDLALICLPCIRLNVTSEVIIRNLLAYEALAKPNRLILARHVKLMCALIDTPEDVQLLVDNKIIQGNLRNEVVAQLFNDLRKTVNTCSEKIQVFELQIERVKATLGRLTPAIIPVEGRGFLLRDAGGGGLSSRVAEMKGSLSSSVATRGRRSRRASRGEELLRRRAPRGEEALVVARRCKAAS
ncbi:hypothetical protein Fmac_021161 [Flemingia macrophylla]|uniref:Uncharacterized protein n=1 Tax=Flemingia macrophylla TaxID=520843 RepID=A0ABD1LW44_9FABA